VTEAMKEQVDDALLRGVERTFGKITIDLAATDEDHKAPKWITPERDTFSVNWAEEIGEGLGWLNPPPEQDLMRWSEKCALEGKRNARFVVIVPAIVDTFWFWEYLIPNAANYVLYPRKFYQGEPMPLILSAFNVGPHQPDGRLHLWNWTTGVIR
jgi:hypothetical protein